MAFLRIEFKLKIKFKYRNSLKMRFISREEFFEMMKNP